MSYRLSYTPNARKEIRAIRDQTLLKRLDSALRALEVDPRPHGALRLTGRDEWRIRVGDWRVIYRIDDGVLVVLVVAVAPRGEVYR